eukprot:TRINITY_DN26270_c0_g3_i1.p1 TRINITY_DN26270_c0_g3~~TRINITY_DN26270_c0_g3_i1.p1  ORF type:complete len:1010 (-),score=119.70 TRINITY_DN26270_c0_g3_i1:356-3385(-)
MCQHPRDSAWSIGLGVLVLFVLGHGAFAREACYIKPTRLRTNNLENPLGTPTAVPRFSWALTNTTRPPARNQVQTAYRILCSRSRGGVPDLWDSGPITSSESLQIPYGGATLRSSQRVYWRVQVWNEQSVRCEESEEATFEVGLVAVEDWRGAEWLVRSRGRPNMSDCEFYAESEENRAPRFRIEFIVPAGLAAVRAYVTGLGYYQMYIDGSRVGDSYLDPGWTTYSKEVLYAVHDVSSMLISSDEARAHVVGIELGNGMWNPLPMRFWGSKKVRQALVDQQGRNSSVPMFKLLLLAEYSNGTLHTLVSSSRAFPWRASGSPTTFNNVYLGEKYDARLERHFVGWAEVGFHAADWTPAAFAEGSVVRSLGALRAQAVPPIRRQGVLRAQPLSVAEADSKGAVRVVFDTGRNHAGVCRFRIKGPEGAIVSMLYGELLHENGSVNPMTSVAGQIKAPNPDTPCQPAVAVQSDQLTLSGRTGGDVWSPSWGWRGFRYVQVDLPLGAPVSAVDVECYPMRSDLRRISNFTSSDAGLQQIRVMTRNSFDSNMMSVHSDCPHRERFGYGGDALGCGEAGLSMYDWSTFYAKRIRDFNDAQRSGGGFPETAPFVGIADKGLGNSSGPIGWETYQIVGQLWLYKYYGDRETMLESFNSTYSYIKLLDKNPIGINAGLGDWMPLEETSSEFTGQGFQMMSYLAFANISAILGMPHLEQEYRNKVAAIGEALNSKYLDASTGAYTVRVDRNATVKTEEKATQCGQGMALFLDIVPANIRKKALAVMAANARAASFLPHACSGSAFPNTCPYAKGGPGAHMTAGLFGIKWFLMSLADGGMNDLAYEVVSADTFPSYKWMMNNPFANATTLWESWFFSDNIYSHNHPMFGSSEVWLQQAVAGLRPHPAARGMDRILIQPSPPRSLQHAGTSFETPRGIICVRWQRFLDGMFHLYVLIPPNIVATVHMPMFVNGTVFESDSEVFGRRNYDSDGLSGSLIFDVGSGEYNFKSTLAAADSVRWI